MIYSEEKFVAEEHLYLLWSTIRIMIHTPIQYKCNMQQTFLIIMVIQNLTKAKP